jgi:hypothetical protein
MSITAARLQAEVSADTKAFDSGMSHADQRIQQAPGKWAEYRQIAGKIDRRLARLTGR